MTAAMDFHSTAEADGIPPTGPICRGWIAADLNKAGTVGNAALAAREKGMATAQHQVAGFINLLGLERDTQCPTARAQL